MNNIKILRLEVVSGFKTRKLFKTKEIFQLKKMDDETYKLYGVNGLVFRGHYKRYREESNLTLCYIINDNDVEINNIYGSQIESYNINEAGELKPKTISVLTKK